MPPLRIPVTSIGARIPRRVRTAAGPRALVLLACVLWSGCSTGPVVDLRPGKDLAAGGCIAHCLRPNQTTGESLTAIAVQGNPDRGLPLAHQFVNGCDSQGQPVEGSLGVPANWHARHLHCNDGVNHRSFFIDETHGGKDLSSGLGLENGHLIFYSGHGRLRSWKAYLGTQKMHRVRLDRFSLGDGLARYLWFVSCNVMGHGPFIDAAMDYVSPRSFDPVAASLSGISEDHVDAFRRWSKPHGAESKPALHPNLRLACGGSSLIGGGHYPGGLIWHRLMASENLPIADAFILALTDDNAVPLCLARGEKTWWRSPLLDTEFTALANERSGFLHALYPIRKEIDLAAATSEFGPLFNEHGQIFGGLDRPNEPPPESPCEEEPCTAPVLILKKAPQTPLPPGLEGLDREDLPRLDYGFAGGSLELLPESGLFRLLGDLGIDPRSVRVKRHPGSGAVVLGGTLTEAGGQATTIPLQALAALGIHKLPFRDPAEPPDGRSTWGIPRLEDIQMEVQTVPEERAAKGTLTLEDVEVTTKERLLRVRLSRRVPGLVGDVPVFGPGGQWLLRFTPELDSLVGMSYVARHLATERDHRPAAVKKLPLAISEARRQLGGSAGGYRLRRPVRWGYRAAAYHCEQPEMYLVYQMDFVPRDPKQRVDFPPVTIEVPAHEVEVPPICE